MKKIILLLAFSLAIQLSGKAGVPEANFDHSSWTALLSKYVSPAGAVNYDGFKKSEAQLNAYLKKLEQNSPQANWSKSETMAYWINAYNAYTIKLILNNYPLKSIMDINGGKAWDLAFINIDGKKLSLNNIEHDILRAKYKDPRIHFAVNCASISCPKLKNSAFTGADLDRQLKEMSIGFINNPLKNKLSASSVQVSKLFEWYKDDFTQGGTVIDFLNQYAKVKIQPNARISYMNYNWNLNNK